MNFFLSVPATRNEYQTIKQQLEVEKIPGVNPGDPTRSFHSLTLAEQAQMEKKRLQGKMCSANKSDVILGSRFSGMKRVCAFKSWLSGELISVRDLALSQADVSHFMFFMVNVSSFLTCSMSVFRLLPQSLQESACKQARNQKYHDLPTREFILRGHCASFPWQALWIQRAS